MVEGAARLVAENMHEEKENGYNVSNIITLHFNCLPDMDLSANKRRGMKWGQQKRFTDIERNQAVVELREAGRRLCIQLGFPPGNELITGLFPWPVELHWTFYWPKGTRSRDAGNCEGLVKVWVDVMVKPLGWLRGDSLRYVRRISYGGVPGSPLGPSMKLEIVPLPSAGDAQGPGDVGGSVKELADTT